MKRNALTVTSFISQMCEQSYYKLLSSGFKKKVMRPWMKVREIDIIKEILKTHKPMKCLEWGAGYSTLYYPKYLGPNAEWISIEHEKDWFLNINKMNTRGNVRIHHVAPNRYPWTDPLGDGAYADLTDYIEFPEKLGRFDFILVDGRARVECIKKGSELLSDHGIVILHDANRKNYEEPWKNYRYQALFRDYRDIVGGFWIGSQKVDLRSLIDIDFHMGIWKMYEEIGKTSIGNTLRI